MVGTFLLPGQPIHDNEGWTDEEYSAARCRGKGQRHDPPLFPTALRDDANPVMRRHRFMEKILAEGPAPRSAPTG
ncbi:hypothetical protein [Paracoccus shandongensis]|uniref:hypothetical protein n=1 Tax=Paracoccus shandongensis TaxID=2816048 RepID=UPI001A8E131B|nr:hypothetical protein [Paracoccus shandongensis]